MVKGEVFGQELDFLFDTGAQCTVVSGQVWDRVPTQDRPPLTETGVSLMTVAGQWMPVRGSLDLTIQLQGRPVTCQVLVSDMVEEAVLGADVLEQLRAQWDWDTGTMCGQSPHSSCQNS